MPARRRRVVAFLAPWVLVLPLAVEFGAVLWRYQRESGNAFVAAREHQQPWPVPDAESALVDLVPPSRDTVLPVPSRLEELAAHAAFLLHEDDMAIRAYAEGMKRQVVMADEALQPSFVADPNSPIVDPALAKAVLARAEPIPLHAGPVDVQRVLAAEFMDDPAWVGLQLETIDGGRNVLIRDMPFDLPPADSPYLRPFLSFKPHGKAPDGTVHFGLPEFRLNNFGFRGEDVAVPRPPEVFRVACVGASTTMEGARDAFTYPALVQRFLRERFPDRRIEVVNCGVAGINSTGERFRTADYLALEPNAMVIYEGVNDICHVEMRAWRKELGTLKGLLQKSAAISSMAPSLFLPSNEEIREDLDQGVYGNFAAMAVYAQKCGVIPVVCTFCHPDGPHLSKEEWAYYDRDARLNWTGTGYGLDAYLRAITLWNDLLRDRCAEAGIRLIDVAAQLSGGGRVFGDICHMKDYGIEQKARVIAEGLAPLVEEFFSKP